MVNEWTSNGQETDHAPTNTAAPATTYNSLGCSSPVASQSNRRTVMSISDRLDEIERRCADSWSGPWSWELDDEERITLHAGGSVPFDLIRRDEFRGPSEVAEFISHARTDVPDLLAALRAVLDLHEGSPNSVSAMYPDPACNECGQTMPCPTVRAVRAALEVEVSHVDQ